MSAAMIGGRIAFAQPRGFGFLAGEPAGDDLRVRGRPGFSSMSTGRTSKGMPRRASRSRRRGEAEARMSDSAD